MTDTTMLMVFDLIKTLIQAVAPVLGAVAACGAVWISWTTGKKVDKSKLQVEQIRTAVEARSTEELNLIKTGAFQLGVLEGERRVSDFSKLQDQRLD